MAKSATQVSLAQMVDLALNCPEVGVINLSVLHTLLHVIVSQLDIGECNVEFRDKDSERIQSYITVAKPAPKFTLTEYTVAASGKGPRKKKKRRSSGADEKGKSDENQTEKGGSSHSFQTVVVVEPIVGEGSAGTPQFTVAITKDHINKIEKEIEDVRNSVTELKELPGNIGLIDAIRSNDSQKSPLLDAFQIMNLLKRMDGLEVGFDKMVSMLEDLAREQTTGTLEGPATDKAQEIRSSLQGGRESIENLKHRVCTIEQKLERGSQIVASSTGSEPEIALPSGDLNEIRQELMNLKDMFKANDCMQVLKDVEMLKGFHNIDVIDQSIATSGVATAPETTIGDNKYNECLEQLNTLDTMFNEQIHQFGLRLESLEKDLGDVLERTHLGDGDNKTADQNVSDLYNQVIDLQEQVGILKSTTTKLWQTKEDNEGSYDDLREQVELLKVVKADKEDLDDALADKADTCMINRKVSLAQFDAAYDDLTNTIEAAVEKLRAQESLWTQTLDDIQKEVGSKLDRMELAPLRDFINSKLKVLQEKLKTLTALKQEHEAAGSKSEYLKNVNCLSCDNEVIMKKEVDSSMYPRTSALPPHRNMGPYLAYELDQLRKQQKCLPNSRNLNILETALQGKPISKATDHVCNRYCGGSHTVTTPQQRVTRMGHFLEQWGPEIVPVVDVQIKGTDGNIYKGRSDSLKHPKKVESPSVGMSEKQSVKSEGPNQQPPSQRTSQSARPRSSQLDKKPSGKSSGIRKSAPGKSSIETKLESDIVILPHPVDVISETATVEDKDEVEEEETGKQPTIKSEEAA